MLTSSQNLLQSVNATMEGVPTMDLGRGFPLGKEFSADPLNSNPSRFQKELERQNSEPVTNNDTNKYSTDAKKDIESYDKKSQKTEDKKTQTDQKETKQAQSKQVSEQQKTEDVNEEKSIAEKNASLVSHESNEDSKSEAKTSQRIKKDGLFGKPNLGEKPIHTKELLEKLGLGADSKGETGKEIISAESLLKSSKKNKVSLNDNKKKNVSLTQNKDLGLNETRSEERLLALEAQKWQIKDNRETSESSSKEGVGKNSLVELSLKSGKNSKGKSDKDSKSTLPSTQTNTPVSVVADSNQSLVSFDSMVESKSDLKEANKEVFRSLVQKAKVNIQKNGNSTAIIKLNPGSLGHVTLNLSVEKNTLQGNIIVESQGAMKLMKEEIESLRMELRQQGIQVDGLNVKVREASSTMDMFDFEKDSDQKLGFQESSQKGESNEEEQAAQSSNQEVASFNDDDYGTLNASKNADSLVDISI